MKALYDTANRAQRIRYAHSKRKEGLTVQEIAYLLHAGVRTVEDYLSIPEDQIPEDKNIVRERLRRTKIQENRQFDVVGLRIKG